MRNWSVACWPGTEEARRAHARLAEAQEVGHVGSWEWNIAANERVVVCGALPDLRSFRQPTSSRVMKDFSSASTRTIAPPWTAQSGPHSSGVMPSPSNTGWCGPMDRYGRCTRRGLVACDAGREPGADDGHRTGHSERKQAEEARAQLIHEQAARTRGRGGEPFEGCVPGVALARAPHAAQRDSGLVAHDPARGARRCVTQTRVETIYRNAVAQQRLVSDILDVARIASGRFRMNVEPVGVARLGTLGD